MSGWGILRFCCGAVFGGVLVFAGLASAGRLTAPPSAVTVALAQRIEAGHREVDVLLRRGEVESAIAVLERMCKGPWPAAPRDALTTELYHDAVGRLLRVRLDHPDVDPRPDAALLQLAQEALGSPADQPTSPFTARLLALQGELHERQGDDDAALTAYERALEMNGTLLAKELAGGQASGP